MPKKQSAKSTSQNISKMELNILIVLIVILLGVLAFAFHKYQQTHSYISNPDPALFNK